MITFRMMDCGSHIGVGVRIGSWRKAWRVRNPFFLQKDVSIVDPALQRADLIEKLRGN